MITLLPEGTHKFSGIEPYKDSEGYFIIIDNVLYAFECDPDDGFRSYGNLYIPRNISVNDIKNRFPAQDVIITLHDNKRCDDSYKKQFYTIINAKTGKLILKIGTDYTDDYYPVAICHYYPENMTINQQTFNITDTSNNNYINDWVVTSTKMSDDYLVDENITYIYN